jgi:hypothetical protein
MTDRDLQPTRILLSPPITGALSIASALVAGWLLGQPESVGARAIASAILPVPFFMLLLISLVRWTRRLDELAQQVQLEALGITAVGSAATTFIVGYLQRAGVLSRSTWDDVWLYMGVIYLVSWAWAARRYR